MTGLTIAAVASSSALWLSTAYRAWKKRSERPKVAFIDSRRSRAL